MKIEQAFATVLKRERLRKALTQEQLASACSCHTTYISLMERGKKNPSLKILFCLSQALELSYADFSKLIEQEIVKQYSVLSR